MKAHAANPRRSFLKTGLALALTPVLTVPAVQSAHAAAYPAGPVTMMVPYPAGGPSDVSARILSGPIGEALKTQVVVENLGGATGTIAASKVLNANADGNYFFQG